MKNKNVASFIGKSHSDETIKKMRETHKKNKHQQGEKNSHYGTMWINHPIEKLFKSIRKEDFPEFEKNGWLKGRSFTSERDLEKRRKKEELKLKKLNDELLKEQKVEKEKQEKILQKQLENENKIIELRRLYEIYKVEGFDGVLATGYIYTKQNLVNQMMHNLPEFVSQNGKRRKNIV